MGYVRPEDFDAAVAGLVITRERRREIQKKSRDELQFWVINLYKAAFEDGINEIEHLFEIRYEEADAEAMPFEEISVSWEDVLAVIAEVKGVGPKILAGIDKKLKEKY